MAITDNLISFWELDDANDDVVASANDLTNNNVVTFVTGKVGNAANFVRASSQSLSDADTASLSTGDIDFTICAWARFTSHVGLDIGLVGRWDASSQQEYFLGLPNGNPPTFYVSTTGGDAVSIGSAATVTTATWYFIVVWHDSVGNTINIQVDNGTADGVSHSGGVYDSTAAFRLGTNGGSSWFLDGDLDQVGFWKRVLTSDERTYLYNSGAGRSYADLTSGSVVPIVMSQFRRRKG
jgi:hypothetical protein